MPDFVGWIVIILIVLGLFYLGGNIVKVTKESPNEDTAKLVGKGLAEAGKQAGKTIAEIGSHLINSNNTTNANITTPITANKTS